jgi:hypothetical protein
VTWTVLVGLAVLGWAWWTRRIGLRWLLMVLLVGLLLGQTSGGRWAAKGLSAVGSGIASGVSTAMQGANK